MGSHPINLALRFMLELSALIAMGILGWNSTEDWIRYVYTIGIPAMPAAAWGIFAVPGDSSRSGAAPVPVPGWSRLLLELLFFAFAAWCIATSVGHRLSVFFTLAVVLHYGLSYDRVLWLLTPPK